MTKGGKWLIAAGIVALLAIPVALRSHRGGNTKQVEIETVEKRVISPTILASGNLTYQTEIRMVSEVMGRVKELRVKEGDLVKKGDVLLRLDPATVEAQVSQLEAAAQQSRLAIQRTKVQLATIETKLSRYEKLRTDGLVDQNTYDDLKSQRDLARVELDSSGQQLLQTQAQLSQMREQLAKTVLRAPIDGRVTQLTIKIGETAVPSVTSIAGSDLMVVSDTSNLYAEVNVNETDVARINVGQEARIAPAAFPDDTWPGTVETVAVSPRQVAGQGKTYPVKIRLQPGENPKFHTGMSCRAEIVTRVGAATAQVAVPVQAVRYEETTDAAQIAKASVFIVKDGRVTEKKVETGTADDAWIAVKKGVEETQDIVVGPARILRFLKDGDRVTRMKEDEDKPAPNKTVKAAKHAADAPAR
ncbi:MAG: efflux RND transporter periplasmic adaptor subunit [Pseudomonadota bacterium]